MHYCQTNVSQILCFFVCSHIIALMRKIYAFFRICRPSRYRNYFHSSTVHISLHTIYHTHQKNQYFLLFMHRFHSRHFPSFITLNYGYFFCWIRCKPYFHRIKGLNQIVVHINIYKRQRAKQLVIVLVKTKTKKKRL